MSSPSPYSFKQRMTLALAPRAIAWLLRAWAWTWRVRVLAPPQTQPSESVAPTVYGLWHDGIIAITANWRDHDIQGLASQSFDGELIARAMGHLGYPPLARGSSSRGGAEALAVQLEGLQAGRHVCITMDGPKGPLHRAKPGAAVLAARSGRKLAPVVCAASPDWRLKNWDRTLLPPPFAKVAFVFGEAIPVTQDRVEAVCAELPAIMERLHERAQATLSDL